ncbi:MAG: DUF996 domain-containing protein [Acidilobaceae archaeon]|nr:DUF996 domain-containing protein [Acidilobaceae archaeon]MDW7974675.1 DUF996 domain-containing protein [Sulfolobales archaeon]
MEFGLARTLGLAASLLLLLGLLFPLLWVLGATLLLVSLHFFSRHYGNPSIFRDYLYSLLALVAAFVLLAIGLFLGLASFLLSLPFLAAGNPRGVIASLGFLFLPVLLFFLLLLLALGFYYGALKNMARSSGRGLFSLSGSLALAGGLLILLGLPLSLVILGLLLIPLGYLLLAASYIALTFAFLGLGEPSAQPAAPA